MQNSKTTKLVLVLTALIATVYSHFLLAETTLQETSEPPQLSATDQAGMVWSLMPGESLAHLASLFYPKNKNMQQIFITNTLRLSHKIQPNLSATASSSQMISIVIPDLKLISKLSNSINPIAAKNNNTKQQLAASNGFKEVMTAVINPKMPLIYDELVKKNEFLKLELEQLNVRLAGLQQVLEALKLEVAQLFANDLPVARTDPIKPTVVDPIRNTLVQNGQLNSTPVANDQKVTQRVENPIVESAVMTTATETNWFSSQYLWMSILPLILVISLFVGFIYYSRRQAKNLYLAATGKFSFLGKKASTHTRELKVVAMPAMPTADSSDAHEFTHSMPGADIVAKSKLQKPEPTVAVLYDKNEAELILEQAKIFVQIDRSSYAVKLLKTQIHAAPKTALHHWLYLLDIYRNTDQKEEFLKYAKQLHENFNVMIPLWESSPSQMAIASSIEEFSHISSKVTKLWADCEKEANKIAQTKGYLDELLTDNRDSERAGFSMEVFQEIIMLRDLLDVRDKLAQID